MELKEGHPVSMKFAEHFVCTDQSVQDLALPKPETRFCLLELPKECLATVEAGTTWRFQEQSSTDGDTGCAALCTDTATFSVEFLETTNSLFLGAVEARQASGDGAAEGSGAAAPEGNAPPASQGAEGAASLSATCTIFAQCRGQLVLTPANFDAQRVRELLAPSALGQQHRGGDSFVEDPLPRLAMETLEYEVAASPAELRAFLASGPYVQHEGHWRLLPEALEREIIDAALTIITARGWDLQAVDGEDLLQEVQAQLGDAGEASVPSLAVLRKALRGVIAEPAAAEPAAAEPAAAATPSSNGETAPSAAEAKAASGQAVADAATISLDKAKVSQARALQLLREAPAKVRQRFQLPAPPPRAKRPRLGGAARDGPPLHMEEFVAAFKELTGVEETSAEELLKLMGNNVHTDDLEGTVHPLEYASLPQEPKERLKRLFELQTHWRPEAMAALVLPSLEKGVKVDPWLMKWTRTVHVEPEPGKELRMLTKKFSAMR